MTRNRIIDSVQVDYTGYIATWGQAPRGRGEWAFFWGRNGRGEPHWHNGAFPEACRAAAEPAVARAFAPFQWGADPSPRRVRRDDHGRPSGQKNNKIQQ